MPSRVARSGPMRPLASGHISDSTQVVNRDARLCPVNVLTAADESECLTVHAGVIAAAFYGVLDRLGNGTTVADTGDRPICTFINGDLRGRGGRWVMEPGKVGPGAGRLKHMIYYMALSGVLLTPVPAKTTEPPLPQYDGR